MVIYIYLNIKYAALLNFVKVVRKELYCYHGVASYIRLSPKDSVVVKQRIVIILHNFKFSNLETFFCLT